MPADSHGLNLEIQCDQNMPLHIKYIIHRYISTTKIAILLEFRSLHLFIFGCNEKSRKSQKLISVSIDEPACAIFVQDQNSKVEGMVVVADMRMDLNQPSDQHLSHCCIDLPLLIHKILGDVRLVLLGPCVCLYLLHVRVNLWKELHPRSGQR